MDLSREQNKYRRVKACCNGFGWALIVAGVACMIGAVVALIMLGVGSREQERLLTVLAGSFIGGLAAFALCGLGLFRLSTRAQKKLADATERLDSDDSFFVGEDTFATFGKDCVTLHGGDNKKTIRVPYADLRVFSVCTRRRPKEKGEWSVVLEMPMKYVAKEGKAKRDDPPALIQTDGKQRLYDCLAKYGVPLLGETPSANQTAQKFVKQKTFLLPDLQKRKRALILAGIGVLLAGCGTALAFLVHQTLGIVVAVLGIFLAARSLFSYSMAKSALSVYREGLYWHEQNRYECLFLKWEEITGIVQETQEGATFLKVECPYGAYRFPDGGVAYEYLKEHHAEKCKEKT